MAALLIILVFLSAATAWRIGIDSSQTIWGLVAGQISALFLINIFTIIIAGGMVAHEHNWGTIKLLLIRPVNRSRILLAKYMALILFGLFLLTLLFFEALAVNGIWLAVTHGKGFISGVLSEQKPWFDSLGGVLLLYGLRFAEVIIYGTFALMLSTVSKSSTLTVGTSLLVMLFGPEVNRMISGQWAKYLIFANLDLVRYLKSNPSPWPGMSLEFSIMVLLVYGFVFYWIARTVFVKRDVLD